MRTLLILLVSTGFAQVDVDSLVLDQLGDLAEADLLELLPHGYELLKGSGEIRQRVQFSEQWGIRQTQWFRFNKGPLNTSICLERDPGERALDDHRAVALLLSSNNEAFSGVLGDFRLAAGSGLLYSSRTMLSRYRYSTLARPIKPSLGVHYSASEDAYLSGTAFKIKHGLYTGIVAYGTQAGVAKESLLVGALNRKHSTSSLNLSVLANPEQGNVGVEINRYHEFDALERTFRFCLDISSSTWNPALVNVEVRQSETAGGIGLRAYHFAAGRTNLPGSGYRLWNDARLNEQGLGVHWKTLLPGRIQLESGFDQGRPVQLVNARQVGTRHYSYLRLKAGLPDIILRLGYTSRSIEVKPSEEWYPTSRITTLNQWRFSGALIEHGLKTDLQLSELEGKSGMSFSLRSSFDLKNLIIKPGFMYWDIPVYLMRQYVYEPGVERSFNLRMLHGQGLRGYVVLKIEDAGRHCFELKGSCTWREEIWEPELNFTVQMAVVL